jgi:DNA-binding CsgD family transcriptional regulator
VLVGRRSELEELGSALDARRPVVLVGEAGIGKTTLARAALQPRGAFREGGALASLAWSPFLVFRRLLRADPVELPAQVAGTVLSEGASPLLLDDLQWADDASLETVALLIGQVPLVATVRSGEARSDLVVEAMELVGATRIDLSGLDDGDAATLAVRLHPDLDEDQRAHLVAVADGNPLLLGELLRGTDAAPGLVSTLMGRLDSLDPPVRAAAERLAVLGRPADGPTLGPGATDLPGSGLAELVDGRYVVRHSLLAEVIVDALGERADEVRRGLVALVEGAEAAHLLEVLGDLPGARERALAAAEAEPDRRRRAMLLSLAVRCAPDLDAANRVAAARLLVELSDATGARALCDVEGREALDPVLRGGLTAALAEAAWLQGRHDETIELIERALLDLRGTRTGYEVAALAGSTVLQTFVDLDGRPALDRAREAVLLADELGVEQGFARKRLASVLVTAGETGWAELYGEVIELATGQGDEHLRRSAVTSLMLGHWVSGDVAQAEAIARSETSVEPDGFDEYWLGVTAYAAVLGLLAGRPRLELIEQGTPLLDRWPVFRTRPFLESSVILALADAGRHTEAAERANGFTDRVGFDLQWRAIAAWTGVELPWLAGRNPEVLVETERLLGLGVGDYPPLVQGRLLGAHAAVALEVGLLGPPTSAIQPAWRAAPIEWAALEAAATGDVEAAIAGYLAAADAWIGNDVRSEVRCRWAAGDAAARAGLPSAVALLEQAESLAQPAGLTAALVRIRRSLRVVGVHRRTASPSGTAGLSGREAEVLELIGEGMRSADIAAALGVQVSTVESFVRSAMGKLGAGTRVAAAARWRELRRDAGVGASDESDAFGDRTAGPIA